jgi:DNA mismatch repair protein MutS
MQPAPSYPPMLTQYLEYKQRHTDCILLFQVGDFYEIFFDDAVTVAKTLNLTLTSRDKHDQNPIPMCGVPIGVVDSYLDRLVNAGFSVALVSQVGEPPPKGMVQRSLDRIITPGIRIFGATDKGTSIVASIYVESERECAIAFGDLASGVFWIREDFPHDQLAAELSRVAPSECVVCNQMQGRPLDRRTGWVRELENILGVTLKWRSEEYIRRDLFDGVPGVQSFGRSGKRAARLLLNYIDESTVDVQASITELKRKDYDHTLSIDATTRRNLEILTSLRDNSEQGTLYETLNETVTIGGSKTLRQWLTHPLTSPSEIAARLSIVRAFRQSQRTVEALRGFLRYCPDLDRIATRISLEVCTPRELGALRDFLHRLPSIREHLLPLCSDLPENALFLSLSCEFFDEKGMLSQLERFLVDDPPLSAREGGIVRAGYNEDLDRLKNLRETGRAWIAEFEAQERKRSGIPSLKVKFNNVLGYFIEITSANASKAPTDYVRRQSTVNAERFFLPALKEMEEQVLGAASRQERLETELFERFRKEFQDRVPLFRKLCSHMSTLDILLSFAFVAEREGYTEPEIREDLTLLIGEGKHPVMARFLRQEFIPNSIEFLEDAKRCYVLTGPNMGGKSTFLRQIALITVMAQVGSFVPAKSASIGIVDKLFARIGASDNLLEGESTFMVEMKEASQISRLASERSLVLIDEIGRGTSTTDGVALARAILEWLVVKKRCRTIFATHFHEITQLEEAFSSVGNLSVGSVEEGDDVIFTHAICSGPANNSYGIEVAKLAGIPEGILARAKELLASAAAPLRPSIRQVALFPDLPGFRPVEKNPLEYLRPLEDKLRGIEVVRTTPLEALSLLEELQEMVKTPSSLRKSKRDGDL